MKVFRCRLSLYRSLPFCTLSFLFFFWLRSLKGGPFGIQGKHPFGILFKILIFKCYLKCSSFRSFVDLPLSLDSVFALTVQMCLQYGPLVLRKNKID